MFKMRAPGQVARSLARVFVYVIVETPEIEYPGTGQVEPNDAEENKGKKKLRRKIKEEEGSIQKR